MRCSFCNLNIEVLKTITIKSRPMHLSGQTVNVVNCPTHGTYRFILLKIPIVKMGFLNSAGYSGSTMCITCGKPMQPTEEWLHDQHSSTRHSIAVYECEHCQSLNQANLTWRI